MNAIAETFTQAGFPLGFLMFGIYLIFKAKRADTKRYIFLAIGLVMLLFGGTMAFQGGYFSQNSDGDCSPNQVISIGNKMECDK